MAEGEGENQKLARRSTVLAVVVRIVSAIVLFLMAVAVGHESLAAAACFTSSAIIVSLMPTLSKGLRIGNVGCWSLTTVVFFIGIILFGSATDEKAVRKGWASRSEMDRAKKLGLETPAKLLESDVKKAKTEALRKQTEAEANDPSTPLNMGRDAGFLEWALKRCRGTTSMMADLFFTASRERDELAFDAGRLNGFWIAMKAEAASGLSATCETVRRLHGTEGTLRKGFWVD